MKTIFLKLWAWWKSVAQKIGDFQIKVVFSFFYYVLITPLGFIVTLFRDYLERGKAPSWQKIEDLFEEVEELKRQS